MNSIYNFFTNAFDDLIKEAKKNTFLVPFLFLLITIPTHLGLNNIVLCFFLLVAIWNFKTIKIKFDIAIALPIFLYFWMLASYFWSIDKPKTLEALPIAITLFLLPIVFLFIPYFSLKQKKIILAFYSYSTVIFVVFFILRAIIRYIITKDSRAFFYHGEYDNDFGLVPKVLNAIHVSVFVAISFFYFF